ncbi:hypothetical protein FRUB_05138 [Fimbriiglobus ruber]|uniref:Uncharacterized protein n=1 Tax=Fimbriiglobus ruber TaxID=1908690 RepID=A0A225DSP1_9BACT|nr:hypothetical protein FRUB_05138 [Fimbriiglobus ruber]
MGARHRPRRPHPGDTGRLPVRGGRPVVAGGRPAVAGPRPADDDVGGTRRDPGRGWSRLSVRLCGRPLSLSRRPASGPVWGSESGAGCGMPLRLPCEPRARQAGNSSRK